MKKIFSLVLLTGMLTLMSFSNHKEQVSNLPPSEELQDSCYDAGMDAVNTVRNAVGNISSGSEYMIFGYVYDTCINSGGLGSGSYAGHIAGNIY